MTRPYIPSHGVQVPIRSVEHSTSGSPWLLVPKLVRITSSMIQVKRHAISDVQVHFLEGSFLLLAGCSRFCSFFLFLSCTWCDLPTNDGCSFSPKLLATCPKWSFFTMKIFFSSPRWAV